MREPGDPFKLAFVEFTEHGSYHDHSQVLNAEELIAGQRKPLVVGYIHGWHNNSDPEGGDVGRFKDFLLRLSKTETVRKNGYQVVGVYFGWNGASWLTPGLNIATIWDRKNAAERLASNGHCIDALLRIGRAPALAGKKNSYTVFLGHSLGGLILERTLAHTLLTTRYGGGSMPCNLAIMLNPACDSTLTCQLMSSFSRRYMHRGTNYVAEDGSDPIHENRPTIVALTAENDRATAWTFPVSAWVAELGDTRWATVRVPPGTSNPGEWREASERVMHRSTPGNHRMLANYRVVPAPDRKVPPEEGKDAQNAFDANLAEDIRNRTFFSSEEKGYHFTERSGPRPPANQWRPWRFAPVDGSPDEKGVPYDGPDVPYWNVRVPSHLIDDHGGIWSDNCTAMMAAIFRMHVPKKIESNPPPPPRRTATKLVSDARQAPLQRAPDMGAAAQRRQVRER